MSLRDRKEKKRVHYSLDRDPLIVKDSVRLAAAGKDVGPGANAAAPGIEARP